MPATGKTLFGFKINMFAAITDVMEKKVKNNLRTVEAQDVQKLTRITRLIHNLLALKKACSYPCRNELNNLGLVQLF